jgi:antitoxin (DNA-binding transcriptional repressor) of toxin-antitoxin stability system
LPGLIDRVLEGEEVLITRHGRVVAEIRPTLPKGAPPADRRAGLDWLRAQREARPSIDIDSNDVLSALADEQRW